MMNKSHFNIKKFKKYIGLFLFFIACLLIQAAVVVQFNIPSLADGILPLHWMRLLYLLFILSLAAIFVYRLIMIDVITTYIADMNDVKEIAETSPRRYYDFIAPLALFVYTFNYEMYLIAFLYFCILAVTIVSQVIHYISLSKIIKRNLIVKAKNHTTVIDLK